MKKRHLTQIIMALILCAVMCLAACGSKEEKTIPTETESAEATEAATETEKETEPVTESETESQSETETEEGPHGAGTDDPVRLALYKYVPYLEQDVETGLLTYLPDESGEIEHIYNNSSEFVMATFFAYDNGDRDICRKFAYSEEYDMVMEYDYSDGTWHQRLTQQLRYTYEDMRSYLEDFEFVAGFAYVGEQGIDKYAGEVFPFVYDIPAERTVKHEGEAYYVIVPSDDLSDISVDRYENGEIKETLFEAQTGAPVLVATKKDNDDIKVTVTDQEANTITFALHSYESVYDDASMRLAYNFGSDDYMPMRGNREYLNEILHRFDPGLSELGWNEMLLIEDQTPFRINGAPYWMVDMGKTTDGVFGANEEYATYAVSDDYYYVYAQSKGTGDWIRLYEQHEEPVYDPSGFSVDIYTDAYAERPIADTVRLSNSDYAVPLIIMGHGTVKDLKVLRLSYKDMDQNGNVIYNIEEAYRLDQLYEDKPLVVWTEFTDTYATSGIAFTDEYGVTRYYGLYQSGEDGSVVVGLIGADSGNEPEEPDDIDEPDEEAGIFVDWYTEDYEGITTAGEYIVSNSEYAASYIIFGEGKVKELQILELTFKDFNDDGDAVFDIDVAYTIDQLYEDKPIAVWTEFNGTIPNNGISFLGADGVRRYYTLAVSGYDGSLILDRFYP